MTPNRIAAAVAAVVFGIVGVWGAVTAVATGILGEPGVLLAGVLSTNLWLALLHVAIAVALGSGFLRGNRAARTANITVGVLLLVVGLFGLFAVGTPANVIALNGVGNVLHFAGASALLATGLGAPPMPDAASGGSADTRTR